LSSSILIILWKTHKVLAIYVETCHAYFMLSQEEFVISLEARRSEGESLRAIGATLGVSWQAVQQWLQGSTRPSVPVLLLAESLKRKRMKSTASLASTANASHAGE
jgi:DNA-binding transcriptional regulator YiaG